MFKIFAWSMPFLRVTIRSSAFSKSVWRAEHPTSFTLTYVTGGHKESGSVLTYSGNMNFISYDWIATLWFTSNLLIGFIHEESHTVSNSSP